MTLNILTTVKHIKGQKLTNEQIAEIEAAKSKPIVYDEDSPELTPAMEKAFALAAKTRNRYKKRFRNFVMEMGINSMMAESQSSPPSRSQ